SGDWSSFRRSEASADRAEVHSTDSGVSVNREFRNVSKKPSGNKHFYRLSPPATFARRRQRVRTVRISPGPRKALGKKNVRVMMTA
ncbi:MAG: hypothetical protein ACQER5_06855, partial [Pseudomonadota bacterium]